MHASGDDAIAAEGAQRVRIYTLGRFQVLLEDGPLAFETRAHRKPLELLKVLIAQGGEQVSEELLSEALWPDADGDQAHASFATTLHRLRRLIGHDALLLRDRRLTLDGDLCWVDARAFDAALAEAAQAAAAGDNGGAWAGAEEALALYRGPFLEGEFEPPQILPARERLHATFLRHIGNLGDQFRSAGEAPHAMSLYRRALELDPLAEELYQALMRACLEQGQAAEGIAAYQRCREMLQSGAAIEPAPETERLHRDLLEQRRQAAGQKGAAPKGTAGPPPESLSAPPPQASAPPAPASWPARRAIAGAVAVALAVGALLGWIYVARPGMEEAGVPVEGALPLPGQPSIAVLAFENLSGDPEQEYFSDGISESILTRLGSLSDMLVIARNSSFTYKGQPVDVRRIGRELGVRYVLEGSVLRAAGRIRVHAQLIDAQTGAHLWAERYDRDLGNVFAVLDQITLAIVTELEVKLTAGERARLYVHNTDNLEALDRFLRGSGLFNKFEKEANARARLLFEEALQLDPGYGHALGWLGWTHMADWLYRWSEDPGQSLQRAETLARQAVAADENNAAALTLLSRVLAVMEDFDGAIAAGERAVRAAPNSSNTVTLLSHLLVFAGRAEEGLTLSRKAMRLAPYPAAFQQYFTGDAFYFTGHYEDAAVWYRRFLERQRQGAMARLSWQGLVASLAELGRLEDARTEVGRLLQAHPDFSLAVAERELRALPFKDLSFLDRHLAGLRRAGVPDDAATGPTLPLPAEPSIVVLPFDNFSGDAAQDYLDKGLTDSLITELYKVPDLFVIARQSAQAIKGRKLSVQQIGRELGVRYVLEGSVQRSADRIRINAQLIEAASGKHLWAERYDRALDDVFAAQEDLVRRIALELGVRLSKGEMIRRAAAATKSYRAFDLYMQADQLFARHEREANVRTRELLTQAVAADPQFARAVAFVGWTHLVEVLFGWSEDRKASLRQAQEWASRALALDETVYLGHTLQGRILMVQGRHEEAVAESARALVYEPGNAVGMFSHSLQLVLAGRPQEAVPLIDRALRLAPYPPVYFHMASGFARAFTGRHEEAVAAFRAYLERQATGHNARRCRAWLIVSLMALGREAEARAAVAELLEVEPNATLESLLKAERRAPFKDHSFLEGHEALLRQAGVPE